MIVYIGREKHDNPIYASPIAAVRERIEKFYKYDDDDVLAEAQEIVASGDQKRAWEFLVSRDSYEYEGIMRERVIE